jgi:hypothetical protein
MFMTCFNHRGTCHARARMAGTHVACRLLLFATFAVGFASILCAEAPHAEVGNDADAILTPDPTGTRFDFETSEIQGTIRLDGRYHGVTRLIDKRTVKVRLAVTPLDGDFSKAVAMYRAYVDEKSHGQSGASGSKTKGHVP